MIEQTLDVGTAGRSDGDVYLPPRARRPVPCGVLADRRARHSRRAQGRRRRLGTVGYYVLLPNLYYRAGATRFLGRMCSRKAAPSRSACGLSVPR
jgi:carboxymethylenebutenolidase